MENYKIALVEDNTMFANIVKMYLQNEIGVIVDIHPSVDSFLESNIESYNLILLDYFLNISDYFAPSGEIILNQLNEQNFNTPVILFSDIEDPVKIEKLVNKGVVNFIPKSENLFEELRITIQNIIDEQKKSKELLNLSLN